MGVVFACAITTRALLSKWSGALQHVNHFLTHGPVCVRFPSPLMVSKWAWMPAGVHARICVAIFLKVMADGSRSVPA